jgi:hypothetical protein
LSLLACDLWRSWRDSAACRWADVNHTPGFAVGQWLVADEWAPGACLSAPCGEQPSLNGWSVPCQHAVPTHSRCCFCVIHRSFDSCFLAWWFPCFRDIACSLASPPPQKQSGAKAKANEKNPARAAGADLPELRGCAGSTIITVGVRTRRKSGVKGKEKKEKKEKKRPVHGRSPNLPCR